METKDLDEVSLLHPHLAVVQVRASRRLFQRMPSAHSFFNTTSWVTTVQARSSSASLRPTALVSQLSQSLPLLLIHVILPSPSFLHQKISPRPYPLLVPLFFTSSEVARMVGLQCPVGPQGEVRQACLRCSTRLVWDTDLSFHWMPAVHGFFSMISLVTTVQTTYLCCTSTWSQKPNHPLIWVGCRSCV